MNAVILPPSKYNFESYFAGLQGEFTKELDAWDRVGCYFLQPPSLEGYAFEKDGAEIADLSRK